MVVYLKINLEKTGEFYMSNDSLPCHCKYCKNYYDNIQSMYPEICSYLDSLGIDVMRPWELSPGEPDENNIIEYICQYVVFGDCKEDYSHKINDVEFYISKTYPSTNIDDNHFVIEFYPVYLEMDSKQIVRL